MKILNNQIFKLKQDEILVKNNSDFCHYTTREALDGIIKDNAFRFSRVDSVNDKLEIHSNRENTYELCFCCGAKEQIPLWYIYSGAYDGIRLKIRGRSLIKFLLDFNCVRTEDEKEYIINNDFDVYCSWCIYEERNTVKYKNKRYMKKKYSLIDKDFIKNQEWEYEREFRIVVKFHENINKKYIYVPIKMSYFSLMFSPEFKGDFERTKSYYNTKGFALNRISASKLKCKINICDRYKGKIFQ